MLPIASPPPPPAPPRLPLLLLLGTLAFSVGLNAYQVMEADARQPADAPPDPTEHAAVRAELARTRAALENCQAGREATATLDARATSAIRPDSTATSTQQ